MQRWWAEETLKTFSITAVYGCVYAHYRNVHDYLLFCSAPWICSEVICTKQFLKMPMLRYNSSNNTCQNGQRSSWEVNIKSFLHINHYTATPSEHRVKKAFMKLKAWCSCSLHTVMMPHQCWIKARSTGAFDWITCFTIQPHRNKPYLPKALLAFIMLIICRRHEI